MSLLIANYPDPHGAPGETISAAYLDIVQTNFCYLGDTSGNVIANIYKSADAAATKNIPPIDHLVVALGEVLVPASATAAAIVFPTLSQLIANAASAQKANPTLDPFGAERIAIFAALRLHPKISTYTLTDVA